MMEAVNSQATPTVAEPVLKEEKPHTLSETVFAWLCLFAGYLFCRVLAAAENALGAFLLLAGLYAVTAVVLHKNGMPLRGLSLVAALSAVVVSLTLLLCADPVLRTAAYVYALATYLFVLYSAGGNALEKGWSSFLLFDYVRALLVLPLFSLMEVFAAAFSGRGKAISRLLLKATLGIALAIIPTAVVIAFLSYDNEFIGLLKSLFRWDIFQMISHISSILWGIPVGMYFFSAYASSREKKGKEYFSQSDLNALSKTCKVGSPLTVTTAVLPLLVVYVVFFISQWQYYISGFLGQLPDATVYSRYAREGFFQLCAVSVINAVALMLITLFIKRRGEAPSVTQRVLAIVLSVFTLVLIATAIAKMVMYIDCYGLTPKRVYASWFMIVLAVLFLLVIVGQFWKSLKLIPVSVAVGVVLFAALGLSGVDGFIARYNVNRYLDGHLDRVDIDAMKDLGDAAIPHLVYLAQEMDKTNGANISEYEYPSPPFDDTAEENLYTEVANCLYERAENWDTRVFTFTVPRARAEAALRKAGILVND